MPLNLVNSHRIQKIILTSSVISGRFSLQTNKQFPLLRQLYVFWQAFPIRGFIQIPNRVGKKTFFRVVEFGSTTWFIFIQENVHLTQLKETCFFRKF